MFEALALDSGYLSRIVQRFRTDGLIVTDGPEVDGPAEAEVLLRDPAPGDLGWIVSAHGALYTRDQGWDSTFEGLVARIVADYVDHHDPARDRIWIAERAGRPVGCIACVHGDDEETVKLRILLVDPAVRGLGVGGRLVEECVAFARTTGARRMVLFTVDALVSARRLYEAAGFVLVASEPTAGWGVPVVGQTWELAL